MSTSSLTEKIQSGITKDMNGKKLIVVSVAFVFLAGCITTPQRTFQAPSYAEESYEYVVDFYRLPDSDGALTEFSQVWWPSEGLMYVQIDDAALIIPYSSLEKMSETLVGFADRQPLTELQEHGFTSNLIIPSGDVVPVWVRFDTSVSSDTLQTGIYPLAPDESPVAAFAVSMDRQQAVSIARALDPLNLESLTLQAEEYRAMGGQFIANYTVDSEQFSVVYSEDAIEAGAHLAFAARHGSEQTSGTDVADADSTTLVSSTEQMTEIDQLGVNIASGLMDASWYSRFVSSSAGSPALMVAEFYGDADAPRSGTLVRSIERALLQTENVRIVASPDQRDLIRTERLDQQVQASEESLTRIGEERGADLLVLVHRTDIRSGDSLIEVDAINIESAEKVWSERYFIASSDLEDPAAAVAAEEDESAATTDASAEVSRPRTEPVTTWRMVTRETNTETIYEFFSEPIRGDKVAQIMVQYADNRNPLLDGFQVFMLVEGRRWNENDRFRFQTENEAFQATEWDRQDFGDGEYRELRDRSQFSSGFRTLAAPDHQEYAMAILDATAIRVTSVLRNDGHELWNLVYDIDGLLELMTFHGLNEEDLLKSLENDSW